MVFGFVYMVEVVDQFGVLFYLVDFGYDVDVFVVQFVFGVDCLFVVQYFWVVFGQVQCFGYVFDVVGFGIDVGVVVEGFYLVFEVGLLIEYVGYELDYEQD